MKSREKRRPPNRQRRKHHEYLHRRRGAAQNSRKRQRLRTGVTLLAGKPRLFARGHRGRERLSLGSFRLLSDGCSHRILVLALELLEVLLRVGADLHNRPSPNHRSDGLPLLAVELETFKEGTVFLLGPTTDLFFRRSMLSDGRRRRRNIFERGSPSLRGLAGRRASWYTHHGWGEAQGHRLSGDVVTVRVVGCQDCGRHGRKNGKEGREHDSTTKGRDGGRCG